jgi:hypothetical protein
MLTKQTVHKILKINLDHINAVCSTSLTRPFSSLHDEIKCVDFSLVIFGQFCELGITKQDMLRKRQSSKTAIIIKTQDQSQNSRYL